jgi:hypothetical protein
VIDSQNLKELLMRYAKLTLVLLGFAATLFAADPFVATWKMNPAKTKFKAGTAPKEQTLTITEAGSDLMVAVAGTAADGRKISVTYSIPAAGGTGKIIEAPSYEGVSGKRMGPNEREVSYMKGGKAVYTAHSKVAADGNSLSVSAKGLNPLGQSVESTVSYDKVK